MTIKSVGGGGVLDDIYVKIPPIKRIQKNKDDINIKLQKCNDYWSIWKL